MPRKPPKFHDFVGHTEIVRILKRQQQGAIARKEPFPHTLFMGPSGVGKTLLARSLATESGTEMFLAHGYESQPSLSRKLVRMKINDFLFIDEAHNLKPLVQEILYQAIDEWSIPRLKDESKKEEQEEDQIDEDSERTEIEPCTIILATDQPGSFLNALKKRMVLTLYVSIYPVEELKEIIDLLAERKDLLFSAQAANMIAKVSDGLPRKAKQHLELIRFHFPKVEERQIGKEEVQKYLKVFGIDRHGFGKPERQYLRELGKLTQASLEMMALLLGCDQPHVKAQIEALLIKKGFICITKSGRMLTEEGRKWLASNSSRGDSQQPEVTE